jgi:hypothetical protein
MKSVLQPSAFSIPHSRSAFSLVELLTVIFIISLLIGILIPSLSAARNSAKRLTTAKALDSIKVGLEMFKNDNGKDFPQTNGYPPSFAHPPIPEPFTPAEGKEGKFPFLETRPVVTGAHWLPAMLIGVDKNGYIKKSSVPNRDNLRTQPHLWYKPDPLGDGTALERSPLYVDPDGINLKETKRLPGRANQDLFLNWDDQGFQDLPVIADAFDQPILYYAASTYGKPTNMVGNTYREEYNGASGSQQSGPPFYFHEDNQPFTGKSLAEADRGWDFGGGSKAHPLAVSGDTRLPGDILDTDESNPNSFARMILDRKIFSEIANLKAKSPSVPTTMPLRPVNSDSYLLISAGVDGLFGTADDVTNFPPLPEL